MRRIHPALKFKNILLIVFVAMFVFMATPVSAKTAAELQDEINQLQAKISDLQGQQKTLASQISVMDSQIRLTTLRIESTKAQLNELTLDIDTTDKKINKLEGSLDGLTKTLINRIVGTYVVGSVNPFQTLLASENISDFVKRANYLRIAQEHDRRLIYDTIQAKNDYSQQKEIFVDKKDEVESLKEELEGYTNQLDREKADKAALLRNTQNDEALFQSKLQSALSEQRAIQGIIAGRGQEIYVRDVNEGDGIATIRSGASPCSNGTHLHFEVRVGGGLQDPSQYLNNANVTWYNSPDGGFGFSGSWNWPINDPIYITQGYGMTYYARSGYYAGGPHTGIDMYSSSSLTAKAVKHGKLYSGSIGCGGGDLLYSKVVHDDGIQTYYLHVITH